MKRINIRCPYCGARAILRPASAIYGDHTLEPDTYFYVCSRWPTCDSYVQAHKRNKTPMGYLANGDLRHKRIEAHRAMDQLQHHWKVDKSYMYQWLSMMLNVDPAHAHIAQCREYRCEQIIRFCRQAQQNYPLPPPLLQEPRR